MEKFLRSNNFARILAFSLAIILWLYVHGDEFIRTTPDQETFEDVPLQVENLNQDYILTEIPATVDLTLEGLPENFEDLATQEIEAFVDLTDKEPGIHLVRVQGRPPRGLSLVSLEPDQVRVEIEEYITGEFPLEIDIVGEPAENWELIEYTIEPEEVFVGAPQSIFDQIEKVVVGIDIAGMRFFDRINTEPVAFDEDEMPIYDDILIDPEQVTVRLDFERLDEPEPEESEEEDGG